MWIVSIVPCSQAARDGSLLGTSLGTLKVGVLVDSFSEIEFSCCPILAGELESPLGFQFHVDLVAASGMAGPDVLREISAGSFDSTAVVSLAFDVGRVWSGFDCE